LTIFDVLDDPAVWGASFAGESWHAWRAFLAALFALPMDDEMAALYRKHTGRTALPTAPAREAWVIVGRRGGKSRMAALLATYVACFRDHRTFLAPGECSTLPIIAVDRRQARTVFRYVRGLLYGVPMLKRLIERESREAIELTNGAIIEIHTASFRTARSYTAPAAIIDEPAFLRTDESANPDRELVASLRYAMASVPNPLLVAISSPYARRGALYDAHQRHFGHDGDAVLVWQADSKTMNPTLADQVIAEAYTEDAIAARSEFGAEFRSDLETYIGVEELRACVVPERVTLPPVPGLRYCAAIDSAGGAAGGDSYTACVLHMTAQQTVVIDHVMEIRPPFSPDAATAQIAEALRPYGIQGVVSDRYSAEWLVYCLRRNSLGYTIAPFDRSAAYVAALPWLTGRRVELPDHPRLLAQFANLQRRTAASGKDSIDHPRGGHDDLSNAVALGIASVAKADPNRPRIAPIIHSTGGDSMYAPMLSDAEVRALCPGACAPWPWPQ
jgi:hypothetical protein